MQTYDVLVVGGGIAGVSLGYELAADRHVGVIEMEPQLAFHTTGRSVATFLESYGGRLVRLLTTASRPFMEEPADGFGRPLLRGLSLLWVAPHGQQGDLAAMAESVAEFVTMDALTADDVARLAPVFRPGWVAAGLLEPGASEIDVAGLHNGFLGGMKRRGGDVFTSTGLISAVFRHGAWTVTDAAGNRFSAPVLVNAAGAWCDVVAQRCGVRPIGIQPLRRTVFTFAASPTVDLTTLPLTGDVAGTFYFKPEGPHVLVSPADEIPSEPCDARVEESDVAQAIDTINAATTFDVRGIKSSWAGLRNFVADRSPVAGFDTEAEGFFWFVGQGGYGIQIAPALARAGAALVRGDGFDADLVARGLDPTMLARTRLAPLA